MPRNIVFTDAQLNDMLEEHRGFRLVGVTITSPIHAAGLDMCRQLLRLKQLVRDFINTPQATTLKTLWEELQ